MSFNRYLPFIGLVVFGLIWYPLYYMYGYASFGYDESWTMLGALRFPHDFFSAFPPGQKYFSSIDILYLSSWLHSIDHTNLFLARLPRMDAVGLLFIAFAFFVYKQWGKKVALLALALFVLPTYLSLERWQVYSVILPISLGLHCMLVARPTKPRSYLYYFFFGLVFGLARWASPDARLFALLLPFVLILTSVEWGRVYASLTTSVRCALPWALYAIVAILLVLTEFTVFKHIEIVGMMFFFALTLFFLFTLLRRSDRALELVTYWFLAGIGALIGFGPVLLERFVRGIKEKDHLRFRLHDIDERVHDFVTRIFPNSLGIDVILMPKAWIVLFLSLVGALIIHYLYNERVVLWKAITLKPLERKESGVVILAALFFVPMVGSILYGGMQHGGYIQLVRVSALIMIAVSLSQISVSWVRGTVTRFTVLLFVILSISTYFHFENRYAHGQKMTLEEMGRIVSILEEKDLYVGYTSQQITYQLPYFFGEKFHMTPIQGLLRFPNDTDIVQASERYALISEEVMLVSNVVTTDIESEFPDRSAFESSIHSMHMRAENRERFLRSEILSVNQVSQWKVIELRDLQF